MDQDEHRPRGSRLDDPLSPVPTAGKLAVLQEAFEAFARDGMVVQTNRGAVGVIHAFRDSDTIRGLDVEALARHWSSSGTMNYYWKPREVGLKRHEFTRFDLPSAARPMEQGLLYVIGVDLKSTQHELAAAQELLHEMGLRPMGSGFPERELALASERITEHTREAGIETEVGLGVGIEHGGGQAHAGLKLTAGRKLTDTRRIEARETAPLVVNMGAAGEWALMRSLASIYELGPDQPRAAVDRITMIGDPEGAIGSDAPRISEDRAAAARARKGNAAVVKELERRLSAFGGDDREKRLFDDYISHLNQLGKKIESGADPMDLIHEIKRIRTHMDYDLPRTVSFSRSGADWPGRTLRVLETGIRLQAIMEAPVHLAELRQAAGEHAGSGAEHEPDPDAPRA